MTRFIAVGAYEYTSGAQSLRAQVFVSTFFVTIPSFQSERFIERTLQSVMDQELDDHRVHLHVQTALCTDHTLDIVRSFASHVEASPKHLQLFVTYASEPDLGMYDAIRKSLKHWAMRYAEPEIFFWLNSDDLLLPGALRNTSRAFEEPSVKWIIGNGVDVDENDKVVHRQAHKPIPIEKLRSGDFNYAGGDWLRAESTAIRFSLLRSGTELDPELRLAGDYDLFMKLARKAEPTYCDFGIRAFRKHDSQLSKSAIAYQHERSHVRYFQGELLGVRDAAPEVDLARAEVVYYPDYSYGNSYQPLLYAGVRSHGAATLDQLAALVDANPRAVLHLHWLNQIIRLERNRAFQAAQALREIVGRTKSRGQKVVLTVHNIASHEGKNADIEEQLVEHLFAMADAVHVHHPVVSVQIQERYKTFPWGRVVIADHGAYPVSEYLAKSEVLRRFGLEQERPYCVIPGQIRSYKDIDFQLALFQRLAAVRLLPQRCSVLLAGVVHPDVEPAQISAILSSAGVHLAVQRLDDAAFSSVLHHAEFTLLCYRDISTSGSLFHALSTGTPVVAPKLGTIPSYLFEGYNGYLYNADDSESCLTAIRRILSASDAAKLRSQAARSVAQLDWRLTLSKILAKVI